MKPLRAPFPWFGGKSRAAHLIWDRFGDVRNYVEAFFGSGAVLLARPGEPRIETINDQDCYLANFWRAVAADPDQVAHYADGPVNEADLHARHRWLVEQASPPVGLTSNEREALVTLLGDERAAAVIQRMDRWDGLNFVERMMTDPAYFDTRIAGWWVWGQCLWIGSGWCARPEWTGRVNGGRDARGIHGAAFGKLPAIAGRDGGRGAYAKSRARDPEWQQRPHLGSDGQGQGLIRKRPAVTGNGASSGVHKVSLGAGGWKKRPVLQHGEGGRGVLRQVHQVPDLSGQYGASGRGIHASGFHERTGGLLAYMRALSDRLRRVRVCCGDFERVLGPAVTTCIGVTAVLLDPPYPEEGRSICYAHDGDGVWWRARKWALENGDNHELRIALCGYEHAETEMPETWECVAWKAAGGYGRSKQGRANARRERIWFSPGCLRGAELMPLFQERSGIRQKGGET